MSGIVLVAMAGTAAVTYVVTRNGQPTAPPTSGSTTTPNAQPPQYSATDQAAAKQQVCQVFDASTRGQQGQGGLRVNGQVNIPVVLRTVNSVVAVQDALSPATPPDVAAAARTYIHKTLELTTAATGDVSTDEVNRATKAAWAAIDAFSDVCGIPH